MNRRVRRSIFCTTSALALAGLGGVAYCVTTDRPLGAIGCIALLLVGAQAFRMAWDMDVLHQRRTQLSEQERLFEAERGIHERDVDRARRDLADQERLMRNALDIERNKVRDDLDAERDQMEIEFANRRAEVQRAAFAKGFEMGQNGILAEQRHADVIVLPVGANAPTIMGTGTTDQ